MASRSQVSGIFSRLSQGDGLGKVNRFDEIIGNALREFKPVSGEKSNTNGSTPGRNLNSGSSLNNSPGFGYRRSNFNSSNNSGSVCQTSCSNLKIVSSFLQNSVIVPQRGEYKKGLRARGTARTQSINSVNIPCLTRSRLKRSSHESPFQKKYSLRLANRIGLKVSKSSSKRRSGGVVKPKKSGPSP